MTPDDGLHPILRPERHCRKNLQRMIRIKFQAKFLTNRRQHQNDFHHRKRISNTSPRSAAKRKVGVLWQAGNEVFRPSLRLEREWLIEEARIAMHGPLKSENLPALLNPVAPDFAFLNPFPAQPVHRRIKTPPL